ncbi:MAG: adenosylcobinamide-GDP ribazoletransferase [Methanimicrococcus sp.]|nr:adenosylcobinamide-GDP ribazoletransferase [Methanimicrococcus sp.]
MTFWQAFKAGFGFLSVIPVGITMEGIEALMKRLYLYPVVGLCLGLFIGFFSLVAQILLPSPLTAVSIMLAVYGLIWFNHLDGVSDMGDGMTAHGSLEKKRKALKDMSLGIGGVAFAVLLMLSFYSSLIALENTAVEIDFFSLPFAGVFSVILPFFESSSFLSPPFLAALILGLTVAVSEMNGKQAMLTIAAFGKSFSEGLGAMTIAGGTKKNFIIGLVFTLFFSVFLLGFLGVVCVIASTFAAFFILKISNRHFGGLNGDGIGVANEAGRVVSIAAVAFTLYFLYGGMFWTL